MIKEFQLKDQEYIPLCDLMKIMDMCSSGAEAKHQIADGQVTVDGVIETRKRCKIRSGQLVKFIHHEVKVI